MATSEAGKDRDLGRKKKRNKHRSNNGSLKDSFVNLIEDKFTFALLIPVLLGLLIYLPSLWGGFVFTSYGLVEGNDNIKTFSSTMAYFFDSHNGVYSPLMFLSFAVDYKLFGLSSWGYHLTSLIYHLIAVWLFGYLLGLFLSNKGALIGAFFFAIFPLTTDAVLSLSGRSFILAAIFMFLSLIMLVRSDGSLKSLVYCGGFYLLALFSSFYCFVLVLIAPLYLFSFYKEQKNKHTAVYLGVFVLFAVFISVVGEMPRLFSSVLIETDYVASLKNILTLLIIPLKLLVAPFPLKAHYEPISMAGSFFNFYTVGALQFVALTVFLSVVFIKEDRRGLFFITAVLFVSLVPFTHLLSGGKYFTESMMYIPTAVCVTIITIFFDSIKSKKARVFLIVWLVFSSVSLGTATVKRVFVWHDNLTLLEDSVLKSPRSAYLHYNLGASYHNGGDLDKALREYELSVNLNSSLAISYYNIACIYSLRGNIDTSLKALKWSVARGYGTVEQFLSDPELANVRKHEDFVKFINDMKGGVSSH